MLYKCKICGGSLNVNDNETIAVCEYCGTKQTLPRLDSEKKTSLLDRADHFRRSNEYDKAMSIYEQILADEKNDAEIYWLIVLCRYGIEYVEDPSSHKRIPTVNRVQYNSILNDEDYLKALELADNSQKQLYIEEANKINDIQKGILEVSSKEEPFDIFICYKETDDNGRRTEDSVIAQDIYKELTNEGYKVFFSRITLEDKIGTAYEPYIFAALNSAKVMLAIGTKKEYFNAVWVKNEWSRYLALINKGEKKLLVPCYKNMDPYDLPEEFAYLQAQDLNKLGFMQDLIRGIEKIISKTQKVLVKESTSYNTINIDNILKRAYSFLEEKDFTQANNSAERILDIDMENGDAYLIKLLVDYKVSRLDDLKNIDMSFVNNNNYQKALKYGTESLIKQLNNITSSIFDSKYSEEYQNALDIFNNSQDITELLRIVSSLSRFNNYPKAKQLIDDCNNKIKQLESHNNDLMYEKAISLYKESTAKGDADLMNRCVNLLRQLSSIDYKDSKELLNQAELALKYANIKKSIANSKMNNNTNSLIELQKELKSIIDFEDSEEIYSSLNDDIKESIIANYNSAKTKKDCMKIIDSINSLDSNDFSEIINNCNKKIKKIKTKKLTIVSLILLSCFIATILFFNNLQKKYDASVSSYNNGQYKEAYNGFSDIESYKDSKKYMYKMLFDRNIPTKTVVVATGANDYGQCDVSDWNDIVSISIFNMYTVGLKSDGTVVATGANGYGQCDVSDWNDIVYISTGINYTVGLKSDGTVVATGANYYGQRDVSDWNDIVSLSTGTHHTIGLKSDGTVVATGANDYGQCDVSDWNDIVFISTSDNHTIGLKSDGTVVATGANGYGQCDVSEWKDIVSIISYRNQTVGLKSDGTAVATGYNYYGQCDVYWNDIVSLSTGTNHTIGLKSDGTVVETGYNNYGQCNVSDWNDIVFISTSDNHTVGLKSDGTVVATGDNHYGQCNVSEWKDIVSIISYGNQTVGLKLLPNINE